jgi:glutathione transport system ATP-binding protein
VGDEPAAVQHVEISPGHFVAEIPKEGMFQPIVDGEYVYEETHTETLA